EILNFMQRHNEAYEIIKRIAEQEIGDRIPEHEIHARILTQLSRAELGMEKATDAFLSALKAHDVYQKILSKRNALVVTDVDYASTLVTKADVLYKQKQYDEALEDYNKAETIFLNKYGK